MSTFQNIKNLYGHLLPNNITELKPRYTVYVDLIGLYSKYIRQQQPGGAIIKNNVSITFMTMIYPTMGWFEIIAVPTFDPDEVTGSNDD